MVLTANLSTVLLFSEAGTGTENVLPEGNVRVERWVWGDLLNIVIMI